MASFLVTGGSGSLGTALVGRLLTFPSVERVAVISRDEWKLAVLRDRYRDDRLRTYIGDVRSLERLKLAMRGCDTVVHCAALKRIDDLERDPDEAARTNIWGAMNVKEAALFTPGVRRVLAIGTDKAAAPSSVYGASKLFMERLICASNSYSGAGGPAFAAVRYGNVAGSRGSVVPIWREMLARGETPTVTDLRMTRFWVRMEQAVDLVVRSLGRMRGGEIFIPKLPSVRVVDLWRAMVGGGEPAVTGRRPGEKLHEALVTADEAHDTFDLGDDFCICRPVADETTPRTTGVPLPDGFQYDSGTNDHWLEGPALQAELDLLTSGTGGH